MSYPTLTIRVLGSGTSMGVPVVGCQCAVCTSPDPHNKRMRSSISITAAMPGGDAKYLLIDCGIDLREQMLRWPLPRIDAILITHTHSDHINGLDDTRVFSWRQKSNIPLYSTQYFLTDLAKRFDYCFAPLQEGGGIPKLDLIPVVPGQPFAAAGLTVTPVEIMHGVLPILGFRMGNFAYLTDCSGIPEATWPLLEGLDTLILSALRRTPHPTHFNLEQSLAAAQRLHPRRVFFTHITDEMDHAATNATLPDWAQLAYDGLVLDVPA